MKEIKTTKQEVKEIIEITYEAIDGTIFVSKEECEKYEKSAVGVLMGKTAKFTIATDIDTDVIDGSDENKYKCVVPKTQEDIDVLNQIWKCFSGRTRETLAFDEEDINTPIIIGYRFSYNNSAEFDWVWFHKLKTFIDEVTDEEFRLEKNQKKD